MCLPARQSGRISRSLAAACLCLQAAAAGGCQYFDWGRGLFSDGESAATERTAAHSLLRDIPTSRDAVQIEIMFAERRIGDPLLGSELWNEVDELTIRPDERQRLRAHGFLTGVTGASPPRALATLLGIGQAWEVPDEQNKRVGRRVTLPSGGEIDIPTSFYRSERFVTVPVAGGTAESQTFENGRGVLHVKVNRLEGGFVRLEFLPELHHGEMITRPTATPLGWQPQIGQKVERLYDLRFSVDLNIGEFAVVTSDAKDPDSAGHHFFIVAGDDGEERKVQRLLVVRLAGMKKIEAQRAE